MVKSSAGNFQLREEQQGKGSAFSGKSKPECTNRQKRTFRDPKILGIIEN